MPTKLLTSLLFMFGLTACSTTTQPQPYLLKASRTTACQEEIEKSIASLIHAQHLSVSKDVFTKASSLHLTNQKDGILTKSPIFNDLRGRKTLLLYKENHALFIGLLNKKKDVVKSQKLNGCLE